MLEIDRKEFENYYLKWVQNTILSSDINVIFSDENIKNIINMKERAIPFIYEILKERASMLVYVLQYIFGYGLSGGKYKPIDELCSLWVKEIEKTYGRRKENQSRS